MGVYQGMGWQDVPEADLDVERHDYLLGEGEGEGGVLGEKRMRLVQRYENGQACWNGPKRSTTVVLACAEKEEIWRVVEVEKCVYRMEVGTAAVCGLDGKVMAEKQRVEEKEKMKGKGDGKEKKKGKGKGGVKEEL